MKTKRALSLILAVCMLISLLPGISLAGAADVETTIKYGIASFMKDRAYKWNESGPWLTNMNYENTNGFFRYVSNTVIPEQLEDDGSAVSGSNYVNGSNRKATLTPSIAGENYYIQLGGVICFEIYVPVSGTYKMKMDYREKADNGQTVSVYMNQGDAPNYAWNYLVGKYSCAVAGEAEASGLSTWVEGVDIKTGDTTGVDAELTLSKGYHFVSIKSGSYGYIGDFYLVSGNGETPVLATMKTSPTLALDAGKTAQFDTALYMGDGAAATNSYTITYKSDDEDIATVSDSGEIYGVAAGTTTITATAKNEGGEDVTATKTVTVTGTAPSTENAGITITYDVQSRWGSWNSNSVKFAEFTYESNKGLWEYYGNKKGLDSIDSSATLNWNKPGSRMQMKSGWWAIKVVVPKSGVYTPNLSYSKYSNYGKDAFLNLYLVKTGAELSESTDLVEANRLIRVNCTDSTATSATAANDPFDAQYIEAGEYYLVYECEATGGAWVYIGNLKLDGAGEDKILSGITTAATLALEAGKTAQFETALYLNDGTAATGNYTVTYESADEDIASVDQSGTITGVGPGTTVVTASAENEAGYAVTAKKTVTVTGAATVPGDNAGITITYDVQSRWGKWSNNSVKFAEFSYESNKGLWEYYGNTNGLDSIDSSVTLNWNSPGSCMQMKSGWWAIKVVVPKSGVYTPNLNYTKYYNYGSDAYLNLYLVKTGAELSESTDLVEANRLIRVNCTDAKATSATATNDSFEAQYIEAGEYYLVYECEATGGAWVYIGNLKLDGAGNDKILSGITTAANISLTIGQTAQFKTALYLNDGTAATGDYTVTYESADEDVATVDESGTIIGVGPGKTVVTASAENEAGYAVTAKKTVTVLSQNASGYNVTYSIGGADVEGSTYETTNDFWSFNSKGTDYTAVNIKVPVEGEYLVNAESDVYILPAGADIEAALATAAPGGLVSLDVGEYIAVIKGNVGDIVLDGGEKLALMKASMSIANSKPTVSGILSDGSVTDLADATVTYSSSNKDVATINAGGVINDNSVGKTTITANITLGPVTKTAASEYEVTVAPATFSGVDTVYNFMSINGWTVEHTINAGFADAVRYEDVRGITYEYTGTGSGASKKVGNWEYRGVGSDKGWASFTPVAGEVFAYYTDQASASNNLRCRLRSANQYMAFNIKVPAAGKYSPRLEYSAYYTGEASLELYILPGDTANEDIYANLTAENCFGTVDFNDTMVSTTTKKEAALSNIEFDAEGEYILIFKQPAKTTGTYFRLRYLYLDGENCLRKADVELSDNDLLYGETAEVSATAYRLDGTEIPEGEYTVEYDSAYPDVVTIDRNGTVTAVGDGESVITVTVSDGVNTVTASKTVKATDNTGVAGTELTLHPTIYVRGAEKLDWRAVMASGNKIKIEPETISYAFSEEGIVEADENGKVFGIAPGEVTITLSANFRGTPVSDTVTVTVKNHVGKDEPTYYTYEKRANALENIAKYSWAKSMQKSAISNGNKWAENYEVIYNNIPGEGLPRSIYIGYFNDPDYKNCKWCGTDVVAEYGASAGGWTVDIINRPWKIQCPDCKQLFPTNDFESFWKLGHDTRTGMFDRQKALNAHHNMVFHGGSTSTEITCECALPAKDDERAKRAFYGYGEGYLKNTLYSDLSDANKGEGLRDGETVETWGVDDGLGYIPLDAEGNNYVHKNGVIENHAYIPYYVGSAYEIYASALQQLADAYLYTNDIKYGRAGAIIADRIADVYKTFDQATYWKKTYPISDGGSGRGHIIGRIADPSIAVKYVTAMDAFYPALDDSGVISFLEAKAEEHGSADINDKSSALAIWQNWDENVLTHIYWLVQTGRINGNYGLYHHALSAAALVKDSEPESGEMIAWLYEKDDESTTIAEWLEGGDFTSKFVDVVDRNGMGNEASAAYNGMWLGRLNGMADMLSHYKGEKSYNPFEHPKFVNMFMAFIPIITVNSHTANMGDNNGTAEDSINFNQTAFIDLFKNVTDSELKKKIAEAFYIYNDYDVSGLTYGIFEKDPERLADEIEELVGGKPPVFPSEMLTGYGFAILRDGEDYISASSGTANNNMRDFWVWFGRNAGHGHTDVLEIGIEAYGLNLAPDLGYPEITGTDAKRLQWISQTISHNTVSVNKSSQQDHGIHGYPHHFDDSGKIKAIDISAPKVYEDVDEYRRTVVMVEVNDDVSYGVDFFRVLGGDAHTYSFHSQAENAYAVEGLEMTEQKDAAGNWKGSYADPEWDVGEDPNSPEAWTYDTVYPRGYSWMGKVRRDEAPADKFAIEFDVEDYRRLVTGGSDITLRVTQMNNFTPSEVAITSGPTPDRAQNKPIPATFDYMIVQREGKDLDSMFTTVYEPYKGDRYLKDMNAVEVTVAESSEAQPGKNDIARAVKVEHVDGRVDYIVHATNTAVTYNVDGVFDFRGAIGVYTTNAAGEVITRYVNDGDIIGEATESAARLTGTVADFERELAFENYIDVNLTGVSPEELAGKYIYVDNDGVENGVYPIKSAEDLGDGVMRLHTGLVTLIRAHRDPANPEKGYIYNIKPGQSFTIPLAFADEGAPEITPVSDSLTTSAGSSITVDINAESPLEGRTVTYIGTTLPRGASINAETGVVTWKPDASQIGDNHVAVTAVDSDGRESTVHFTITVYGATTGSTTSDTVGTNASAAGNNANASGDGTTTTTPDNSGTSAGTGASGTGTSGGSSGGGSGGGGGGGGGGATTTTPDDTATDNTDKTDNSSSSNEGDTSGEDDTSTAPGGASSADTGFIDLDNHAWAADSINALADDGIVKGTTANTYSPASNITRADYAILLVRAFDLTSDDTANFADVSASDYFASELATARNTGIVNGIGDNKYAPRNTVTRQDMMVIIYRALEKLGKLGDTDATIDASEYPDYADVAEYARDAVDYLISNGLVNGKNGRIAPTDYTTRAEVAVLLRRILDYIE